MKHFTVVTEELILKTIQDCQRPLDLFVKLTRNGYSSQQIKRVVSKMLHSQQLELTPGRVLRPL